ncbi:efflux RND transporter periplasmic adaptor subunit [Parapedobacter sp. GCM10030251]|uniref:efflux RND transporter periplasmic adaptor subunit n=1 Tax=Parapedobacter sp. GCM10030251 TaxID=3273419 RepID=UPI00360BB4BA
MNHFQFSLFSMLKIFVSLLWCIIIISCRQSPSVEDSPQSSEILVQTDDQPTEVEATTLTKTSFHQELIANGKLNAIRRADLKFRSDGIIEHIHVAEGNRIQAGQLLAVLNGETLQQTREQMMLHYRKAVLDYEDQLLRQGFRIADTAALSEEVKQIARLRSGLSDAELELSKVEKDLQYTRLYAPFAGKLANLKAKAHNLASSVDYICTLIDDSEFHVEFAVLEQELDFVRQSESVRVTAFSEGNTSYAGKIVSINPQVDKAGMVMVKAVIRNQRGKLVDGMGVNVTISRDIGDQLVVPKEAVLDRQGRKVVFTVTDEGSAYWNYVEIGYENSTHYAIKDGLQPGDRVIFSGNFNLAHNKPIVVQQRTP